MPDPLVSFLLLQASSHASFNLCAVWPRSGLGCRLTAAKEPNPQYLPDARYPGIVEVDLIFPQNTHTYALDKHVPVVFALQNPHLAEPLDLQIEWLVKKEGSWEHEDIISKSTLIGSDDFEYSSSDPFFHFQTVFGLRGEEGTWQMDWELPVQNCSETERGGWIRRRSVVLSTKNGSQEPDVIAATEDPVCAESQGIMFNITRLFTGWFWDEEKSCPDLPPSTSTPNPCAAKMNPNDVLSISLEMALADCYVYSRPRCWGPNCTWIWREEFYTCTGQALYPIEKLVWPVVALATWVIYNIV